MPNNSELVTLVFTALVGIASAIKAVLDYLGKREAKQEQKLDYENQIEELENEKLAIQLKYEILKNKTMGVGEYCKRLKTENELLREKLKKYEP